jgi:hypothetical protein
VRKSTSLLIAMALLVASTGCTYHRAHIRYDDPGLEMPMSSDRFEGERLGEISANERGALWNDCTRMAHGSIWHLVDQTRDLGGNALGDMRWLPKSKKSTDKPTCKKGWAWVLIWPVVLTPVFQSSLVRAVAYRVPDSALSRSGLYVIPEDEAGQAALVERILAESTATP